MQYFDKSLPDEETLLTVVDFHRARALNDFGNEHVNDTAMYSANRFEGDIVNGLNPPRSTSSFFSQHPLFAVFGVQRNAVKQTYLKWTDGRIPYTISSHRSKIAEAIEEYRKKTCIDFSPKSAADLDYIHIVPDDGCYSLVGRIGGKQPLSLGDGCIQKGIIIHELMHVEPTAMITSSLIGATLNLVFKADQFDKYSLQMIDHLNTDYDYGSVMHYASTAFSKNGKPTIEPRKKGIEIGQRVGFSDIDLYKINKLYNCPQAETTLTPLPETDSDMKSEARLSSKSKKQGPSGSGSVVGSSSKEETNNLISVLTKVACVDKKDSQLDKFLTFFDSDCKTHSRRPDCEFLSRAGHCESKFSESFMTENCPQSCGRCEITTTTEAAKPCEDSR
ncbi:shTK domain protein [Ancylostoma ceylanicum]|uniref:Metalloendopeptidase n=1 Tax=Ancylostoma ceylanicum TaxID=53326 RepID=A0A0D6MBX2_9BILA|nr:shTK domain protein [Ancylostoma ceylanicum]